MITFLNVLLDFFKISALALSKIFIITSLSPCLHAGSKINLHLCVRKNYSSNIPAIHYNIVLCCQISLKIEKMCPYRRVCRCFGCHVSNLFRTDILIYILTVKNYNLLSIFISNGNLSALTVICNCFRICSVNFISQQIKCYGAVHSACIYIDKRQLLCHSLCNCAFACSCRPVNGNVTSHFLCYLLLNRSFFTSYIYNRFSSIFQCHGCQIRS